MNLKFAAKLFLALAWCLAFASQLLLPSSACAHTASDTYLAIKVEGTNITGQWEIALRDLQHALGLDSFDANAISKAELRLRQETLATDAISRVNVSADDKLLQLRITDSSSTNHSDGEYAQVQFEIQGASRPPKSLELDCLIFFALDPQMRGLMRLEHEGKTQTAILTFEKTTHRFELAGAASPWRQLLAFISEGVWHIWTGYDHILFLVALLLPAVLRREDGQWVGASTTSAAFLNVLKIVTAFTLAHSITLALATLGIVRLPVRLVESVIAASVLLAASNNVFPFFHGRGWMVAFGFGLVHGFGFANVLVDSGLRKGSLALTLTGFNLGVETGQIAIVAIVLPLAFRFRATRGYQEFVLRGGSALVGLVATTWMLERLFDFKVLPF